MRCLAFKRLSLTISESLLDACPYYNIKECYQGTSHDGLVMKGLFIDLILDLIIVGTNIDIPFISEWVKISIDSGIGLQFNHQSTQIFIIQQAKQISRYMTYDGMNNQASIIINLTTIMDIKQSEIINIAVNIFQNVGIKRYIGSIEALMHEDIYFEIYKIIFPDSMINIFKISDSSLTTGQKIQRVINQISTIIGVDLYHIEGEAIAQGNMTHLANWLQLLEALSARCVPGPDDPKVGSEPSRNKGSQFDSQAEDYHTVIGINKEFENPFDSQDKPHRRKQKKEIEYSYPESSQDSKLKPVIKKQKNKKVNKSQKQKQVTFNLNQNSINNQKKIRNRANIYKKYPKPKTDNCSTNSTITRKKLDRNLQKIYQGYPNVVNDSTHALLNHKIHYINKMHRVIEEVERSKINQENIDFKEWIAVSNQDAMVKHLQIQDENNLRTQLINFKINERDRVVDALFGQNQAIKEIRKEFKNQKKKEKHIANLYQQQMKRQAEFLMDQNFAYDVQRMVLQDLGE